MIANIIKEIDKVQSRLLDTIRQIGKSDNMNTEAQREIIVCIKLLDKIKGCNQVKEGEGLREWQAAVGKLESREDIWSSIK